MSVSGALRVIALTLLCVLSIPASQGVAQSRIRTKISKPYVPPRPVFAGIRIGMSSDSALMLFKSVARRVRTHQLDSTTLLETDSIQIYGQAAYLQVQLAGNRVKTIVINFHPLAGDRYFTTRDQVTRYMESLLGRGVVLTNESITYRRWTTEDGVMEVSHSDKYYRVFVRLGKSPLS